MPRHFARSSWISYISFGCCFIRGDAGIVLTLLEEKNIFDCSGFLACSVQDGEFMAYFLGFAQYATGALAWTVLVCMYLGLNVLELLLYLREGRRSRAKHCVAPPDAPEVL